MTALKSGAITYLFFSYFIGYTQPKIAQVILANGSSFSTNSLPKSLQLAYNQSTIKIIVNDTSSYRYRLEGLESRWQSGEKQTTIRYVNLSGGTYKFRLRNNNSVAESQLVIQIEKPFWLKSSFWPFIFLYIIGTIGLIFYIFFRYRYRQQLRLMHTRDRIARDLHDDMGSYLGSISMMSQFATNDPTQAASVLPIIGQNARRVLTSMRDIVWSVNPDNDTGENIVQRFQEVTHDLLGPQEVTVNYELSPRLAQLKLDMEQRKNLLLIFKEVIHNTAQYALAQNVWIHFTEEGNEWQLQVKDDGLGFDLSETATENRATRGNGLRSMQKRAEELGGTLTINSKKGCGTTTTLRWP